MKTTTILFLCAILLLACNTNRSPKKDKVVASMEVAKD